jgi:hypothetical protein
LISLARRNASGTGSAGCTPVIRETSAPSDSMLATLRVGGARCGLWPPAQPPRPRRPDPRHAPVQAGLPGRGAYPDAIRWTRRMPAVPAKRRPEPELNPARVRRGGGIRAELSPDPASRTAQKYRYRPGRWRTGGRPVRDADLRGYTRGDGLPVVCNQEDAVHASEPRFGSGRGRAATGAAKDDVRGRVSVREPGPIGLPPARRGRVID